MAKKIINIGQSANDKSGDPLRTAFSKVNDNFTELYAAMGIDTQIPDQTNNAGKYLTTDGTALSWDNVSRLVNGDAILEVYNDTGIKGVRFPATDNQLVAIQSTEIAAGDFQDPTIPVPLVLSSLAGTVMISPNAQGPRPFWTFDQSGTLTTPVPQGGVFTLTLSPDNFVPRDGKQTLTLTDTPWVMHGEIVRTADGSAEIQLDQIFPILVNPGYESGDTFTFNDQIHHLFGYNLEIVLSDVMLPGGAGWTANVSVSQLPAYPSTINSSGAIKLTANEHDVVLGTDGYLNVESLNLQGYLKGVDGSTGTTGQVLTRQSNGGVAWADAAASGANVTESDTPPTSPNAGDLWYDSVGGRMYVYFDSTWVDTNPIPVTTPSNELVNGDYVADLGTTGTLTVPGFIQHRTTLNYLHFDDNFSAPNQISLVSEGNNAVNIKVDTNNNNLIWQFSTDGTFNLPVVNNVSLIQSTKSIQLNSNGKVWSFDYLGNLTLPPDGDIKDSHGTSKFKTNLSNFTDDLTITAARLTGSTLSSNVTNSSLTSVGTLTGLTSSGVVHITNTENSTNADTGSLQVDGGAHITKNLIAEGTIYAGQNAYSEVLVNPLIVASAPSSEVGGYSQVAILNNTATASGDFQVMIDGYDINGPAGDTGWADLGMAGSNFSDPRYTITQPGDAYVFSSGSAGSTNGGNLVLATDNSGITNDMVFATGGFTTDREQMRLKNSDGSLNITSGKIVSPGSITFHPNDGQGGTVEIEGNGQVIFPGAIQWTTSFNGERALLNWVPGGIGDNDYIVMKSPQDIFLGTGNGGNEKYWYFDASGNLHLPDGGIIKNADGSTYGGSSGSTYSLPTASTTTLGGVKVDGSTIIIDGNGVISSTVVGAVTLKGTWNASTNTPTLSSSLPAGVVTGWQYLVSVTGTRDIGDGTQTYTAGDIVMYDGTKWVDIPGAAGSVSSFNNRTGAVTLTSGDVTGALGFTPYNATNPSGYITSSALTGLATESFVTSQGYITSSGNAATATKLATAHNINGVPFDGTGSITVTAAAGTLTGTTLNAGVTGSSLTSVGTLTNLTVTNPISGSVTGSAGSVAASALTGTTLASGVTSSSLTSVGTLANLTVTNTITGSVSGNAGTVTNGVYTTGTYANPSWITSLAYSKLTGAPTLATVATSGSYTDLTNTPAAYSLPTASTSVLGGVKVDASTITINGSGVISAAQYTLPTASTSVLGGVKVDGTTVTINGSGVISAAATFNGGTVSGATTFSSDTTVNGTLTRSGNISAAQWSLNGIGFKLPAATYTDTTSATTLANNFIHTIGVPTMAFSTATTVGTAATLYIAGDPAAGANATLSGAYSLYVGGKTQFGGAVRFNGNLLSGGGATMMGFSNTTATVYADLSANGQTYHPNRTAFRVIGNSSTAWTTTNPTGGVMTSSQWTLDYQTGTALNTTTGIFTAPYAGLYSVTLSARCKDNASPTAQCMVVKTLSGTSTTSTVCMLEWAANTTVNHIGSASTIKLAVGDTLKFVVTVGSINFDVNDNWTVTFIG